MPHPPVRPGRHRLAIAWPWAGLVAVSTTLAWAMNAGLTGGANGSGRLSPSQSLPLAGDALWTGAVGDLIGDEAPTPRRFRAASKVLTITVEGPAGSHDVRCVTTTERASFDAVAVPVDQLMDVVQQLCLPQPGAS